MHIHTEPKTKSCALCQRLPSKAKSIQTLKASYQLHMALLSELLCLPIPPSAEFRVHSNITEYVKTTKAIH